MTEITQADRDMAAHVWRALDADQLDTASLQIFFARHRMEERVKIVAWLMREEDGYPSSEYSGFAAMIREEIEAKEHLK